MAQFKKAAKVEWKWLGKSISGVIEEVFFESVTKTIKGKKITRHGSKDKPAYLVRSEAGNLALKLETELQKPSVVKKVSKATPQIFR
ncbi:DUF2945 domain-containing protein [Bdellovibrio sp. qaytius]|nr:DUF2945 domain-containing protein [Bdellovibrio sp. qaytius]